MIAERIELALERALGETLGTAGPARLAEATRYAVFPGGARIRPAVLLAVAEACGDSAPMLSDAAAAALELVHCASLVHDDLPAFDDANLRRGRPSVHRAFGVAQAVLVGDGLIFLAFEHLARSCAVAPDRGLPLITALGHRGGPARGICAGQAWELEPEVDLRAYHLAKTGALFIAATQMGAIAAGWKPGPWKELGSRIGEAFQVADDLKDALLSSGVTGKPSGRDEALGRPSAVRDMGPSRARDYLESLLSDVASTIPECPGRSALATKILTFARSTLSNATAPAPSR